MPLNALGALGGITSARALKFVLWSVAQAPTPVACDFEFENVMPEAMHRVKKRRRRDMRKPST
jgi:hypothetical protein